MEKCKSFFTIERVKRLDAFRFVSRPHHVNGHFTSWWGVCGTALLVTIIAAYVISTTTRFFTMPPSSSVVQIPTEEQMQALPHTCFSTPHLAESGYYAYNAKRVTLDAKGFKSKEIDLNMIVRDNNTVCIDQNDANSFIKSYCNPGLCDIVKFKLWMCGTPDKKNPSNDASRCSVSFNEIAALLENNYVDVTWDITAQGEVKLHTIPKANASALYQSTFVINQTTSAPDLLRSFSEQTSALLMHERDSYALQRFFGDRPTAEVLELQIVMSSHAILTQQSRLTSADLIASWGALGGVAFNVLGLVFGFLNQWYFFKQNPRWRYINEDFEVDEEAMERNMDPNELALLSERQSKRYGGGRSGRNQMGASGDRDASGEGASMMSRLKITPRKKVRFNDDLEMLDFEPMQQPQQGQAQDEGDTPQVASAAAAAAANGGDAVVDAEP